MIMMIMMMMVLMMVMLKHTGLANNTWVNHIQNIRKLHFMI
jgi:hypothetical protein